MVDRNLSPNYGVNNWIDAHENGMVIASEHREPLNSSIN